MKVYNKQEAINKINELAKADIPFIFIIDYLQHKIMVEEIENVDDSEYIYSLNSISNIRENSTYKADLCSGKRPQVETKNLEWSCEMPSINRYKDSFDKVLTNILRGNSYLVNLTCKVPVTTNFTLEEIFYKSKAIYKLLVKDRFVCFSPEIFVRIDSNGIIRSYPMKGTIDASIDNALEVLMNDEKEAAEHATIVDLIRNDLSMVSSGVKVDSYRYVDTLHTNKGTILQTSSIISGKLPDDYCERIGDIIFALLPAGSITGAPKKKTMRIIDEAEDYERNFYTGIMGYYKDRTLDSGVMIRFIENEYGNLFFKAGGGITSKSSFENEYNEVKHKIYVPIY